MKCVFLSNIMSVFTLSGLVFGILGSLLMANQYLAIKRALVTLAEAPRLVSGSGIFNTELSL